MLVTRKIEKKSQSIKTAALKSQMGLVLPMSLGSAQANNMGTYRTGGTNGKELGKMKKGREGFLEARSPLAKK